MQSDRPIPGLASRASTDPPDISIRLRAHPDWADDASTEISERAGWEGGEATLLRVRDFGHDRTLLHYSDDTRFHVDVRRGEIWANWADPLTLEDTATYLLGPVMGYVLRRRGALCLHASAVLINGRCIALLGPSGAGKSTLAAAMATRGAAVLTEDVCCLVRGADGFMVQPGYPRIRLWQDAADLIRLPATALPLLTPNWDKRFMPLEDGVRSFHERPEPLAAVLALRPRLERPEPAQLHDLGGQHRLAELAANTYGTRLLDERQRSAEFAMLGELARAVPVRALTLSADGGRLLEACAWIERHALA